MARIQGQQGSQNTSAFVTAYQPTDPVVSLVQAFTASVGGGIPVFVQDTSPVTTSSKWAWLHRDASGNWILDIEDGVGGTVVANEGVSFFLQDTTPVTTATKWVWLHKDVYGNWLLDVEDGKPGYSFYQSTTDSVAVTDSVTYILTH